MTAKRRKQDEIQVTEAAYVARQDVESFARDLDLRGRKEVADLDEQLCALGTNCPPDLLEAREEMRRASLRACRTLEDYAESLTPIARRA